MTKKLDLPLIFLAIAGFLAPLIGGHVSEGISLDPSDSWFKSMLLGGPETPILSHTILAGLCCASLIALLLQRKILQVPNNILAGLVLGLLIFTTASVGISNFRGDSIPAALEWISYGSAFFAVVAASGRKKGPLVLVASIFVGCALLALLGMREYGQMKSIDPTWRIFPQWAGPNAMAGVLVVGFFLGLCIAPLVDQMAKIGVCVGCVAIGLAVFLTQSKGAALALVVGLVLYGILMLLWLPRQTVKRGLAIAVGCVAIVGILAFAVSKQPTSSSKDAGPSAGTRFTDASASADQSVGFRKLLWQSAFKLIEQNPMGTGIATFDYQSAKPGLVTQTKMAHETYLQLAEECSVFALGILLAVIVWWTRLVFKAGRSLTEPQSMLRAGIVTAVATVLMHSFIDSDLTYYGIGFIAFMLLGIALLVSTDAVAPEFIPPVLRRVSIAGLVALTLFLGFTGLVETWLAQARGDLDKYAQLMGEQKRDEAMPYIAAAQSQLESLRSSAPWNAEVFGMSALISNPGKDQIQYAERAVELGPSARNLRQLARAEEANGQSGEAIATLQRLVATDRNNLPALQLLANAQRKAGFADEALATLKRMVAVESTPYFQVRSLTELVVTFTYSARVELAAATSDPKQKIILLKPAVEGYKQYAKLTLPNVIKYHKSETGPLSYAGETADLAKQKMDEATVAAKELADAYRAVGDAEEATTADGDSVVFGKAAGSVDFK